MLWDIFNEKILKNKMERKKKPLFNNSSNNGNGSSDNSSGGKEVNGSVNETYRN